MKTGLVLEGGGIRGIFSAGVLDVLMEEGIVFDAAVGVSAGAAFGCNYKSRQPRRAIRYNLRFAKDPRYSSVRSLLKTGDLFNAQFCYHEIPEKLDPFDWKAFRENPMSFYLVCTDVETGEPVYHCCDEDGDWEMLEWFRASGSMPLVSRVVEIDGYKLLDGGISDSIPLRFMEEQGYERNVVLLTRPAGYEKKESAMMPLMRRALREYPAVVDAIGNRHVGYNETLAYIRQREAEKAALVIRPKEAIDVGRVEHDRAKIRAAYKEGRRTARRMLPAIRRFLAEAKGESITIVDPAVSAVSESGREPAPAEGFREMAPAASGTNAGPEPADVSETAASEMPKSSNVSAASEMPGSSNVEAASEMPESSNVAAATEMPESSNVEAASEMPESSNLTAASATEPATADTGNAVPFPGSVPRSRRHRKTWKPGSMTALKQRASEQE